MSLCLLMVHQVLLLCLLRAGGCVLQGRAQWDSLFGVLALLSLHLSVCVVLQVHALLSVVICLLRSLIIATVVLVAATAAAKSTFKRSGQHVVAISL